jgi:hypothetical protein
MNTRRTLRKYGYRYEILEFTSDTYLERLVQEINGWVSNGYRVWLSRSYAWQPYAPRVTNWVRRNIDGDIVFRGDDGLVYYVSSEKAIDGFFDELGQPITCSRVLMTDDPPDDDDIPF